MKTGGIHIRERAQVLSPAKDAMQGLLAETGEILSKHFGAGSATAHSIDCLLSTDSRGTTLFALPGLRGSADLFEAAAAAPVKRPMKISKTQVRMAELFALKRQETAPENFLVDFIEEFHRRNGLSATMPDSSEAPRKKTAQS